MTKKIEAYFPPDEDPSSLRGDPDMWQKVGPESTAPPGPARKNGVASGISPATPNSNGATLRNVESTQDAAEAARSRIDSTSLGNPVRFAEVKKRLANTKWFIPDLAAHGEITHFYGPSGAGKTLLWVYLLSSLTPEERGRVLYLNFDDSPHGAVQKMELLPGLEMINEGSTQELIKDLELACACPDWVKGRVIILDTLKKFADMIQKKSVKDLFVVLRRLVNQGATIVTLGHTNKHLNEVGEHVFEGVGDIKADSDALILVQRSTDPLNGESTIILTPDENKARAGQCEKAYRFAARDNETEYAELVLSGRSLTIEQIEREKANVRERELRESYADVIDMVEYFLRKNPDSVQAKIVDYWQKESKNYGFARQRLMKALAALIGICWTVKKGANNSKIYQLLS